MIWQAVVKVNFEPLQIGHLNLRLGILIPGIGVDFQQYTHLNRKYTTQLLLLITKMYEISARDGAKTGFTYKVASVINVSSWRVCFVELWSCIVKTAGCIKHGAALKYQKIRIVHHPFASRLSRVFVFLLCKFIVNSFRNFQCKL